MIAEISRKGWGAFCQRLTEFHRGRMIRIEVLGQTGSMETAADDVPLQRFILEEREGECSDVLLLEAQHRRAKHSASNYRADSFAIEGATRWSLQAIGNTGRERRNNHHLPSRYSSERVGWFTNWRHVIKGEDGLSKRSRRDSWEAAHPLTGSAADYSPLLHLVGDKRIVLLGEGTHGTHEFYKARAEICKRLIREKQFNIIAWEADWPDALRVAVTFRGGVATKPRWKRWMNLDDFPDGCGATRTSSIS